MAHKHYSKVNDLAITYVNIFSPHIHGGCYTIYEYAQNRLRQAAFDLFGHLNMFQTGNTA